MTPTPRANTVCLDAETLAAWVDGGLDARAAAMAEAHVSSCPRCQEIAGLIIKTTPAVEARSWFSSRAAWLVPVTAGIAAVSLWMVVPSDRYTAPPAPAAKSEAAAPAQAADQAKPQDKLTQAEPAPRPAEEFRAKEQPGLRARDAGAKNEELKKLKDSDAKRFDEAKADTAADANKQRGQFSPVPPAVAAPAPAPPAPAAPAAVSAAPAASAMAAGRLEAQAPARKEFAQAAAREAKSPDGSIRWRLTPANALERSTDNGQTWVPVETGAGGPLASIEATDANTAIVTTVDGRIFRTSDSGKTWRRQ